MVSGLYKCRADFKRSPTKHFLLNLTVIGAVVQNIYLPTLPNENFDQIFQKIIPISWCSAPAHPPSVYDGAGKRMQERLGPFR